MAQANQDASGTGVVLGILLAVVIAIGAYFFIQNRDGATTLEPAAGTEAPMAGDTVTPGAAATDSDANPTPTLAR